MKLEERLLTLLDRQHQMLLRVEDRLDSIDRTLVRHDENLSEHMRRTELLEQEVKAVRSELEPVEKHVYRLQGVLKFVGVLITIAGIAADIYVGI